MPDNPRRLQIGTLLVWSRGHRHDPTQRRATEGASVRPLHVRDQLTDVAVQGDVLVALELLEGAHEPRDQRLKDGRNDLALGSTTESSAKVGGVAPLAACRAQFGSV